MNIFNFFYRSVLLEADKPTDYTKEVGKDIKDIKDTNKDKDDKPTDYSKTKVDEPETKEETTDDEPSDDEPTDYSTAKVDEDDIDEETEDQEEPTDYSSLTDADSEDSTIGDDDSEEFNDEGETEGETEEESGEESNDSSEEGTSDDDTPKNDKLRKFYLLKDYKELQNFIKDSISKIIDKKRNSFKEKQVDMQVSNNLTHLGHVIGDYMVFKFDEDDYTTALYNYRRFLIAIDLNLEMLKKLNEYKLNKDSDNKNEKSDKKKKTNKRPDKKKDSKSLGRSADLNK